jgi:hypothetical protein
VRVLGVILALAFSVVATPVSADVYDPTCYNDFFTTRTCETVTRCSDPSPNAPSVLQGTQACLTVTVAGGSGSRVTGLKEIDCKAIVFTRVNGTPDDAPVPPPHANVAVDCYSPEGGIRTAGAGIGAAFAPGLIGPDRLSACADGSAIFAGAAYSPSQRFIVCVDLLQ